MSAKKIGQDQIELIAAVRAGVPFSELAQRFELDEARLSELNRQFESVPDEILWGIRCILRDNVGLKKIIADLVARSAAQSNLTDTLKKRRTG